MSRTMGVPQRSRSETIWNDRKDSAHNLKNLLVPISDHEEPSSEEFATTTTTTTKKKKKSMPRRNKLKRFHSFFTRRRPDTTLSRTTTTDTLDSYVSEPPAGILKPSFTYPKPLVVESRSSSSSRQRPAPPKRSTGRPAPPKRSVGQRSTAPRRSTSSTYGMCSSSSSSTTTASSSKTVGRRRAAPQRTVSLPTRPTSTTPMTSKTTTTTTTTSSSKRSWLSRRPKLLRCKSSIICSNKAQYSLHHDYDDDDDCVDNDLVTLRSPEDDFTWSADWSEDGILAVEESAELFGLAILEEDEQSI